MTRNQLIIAILLCSAGCGHKSYNVANPVVGPPPPRLLGAYSDEPSAGEASVHIQTVSYETSAPLTSSSVVARVNGRPVMAGDILDAYTAQLKMARAQLNDDQYRKIQDSLIQRDLPMLIEQALMVQAIKSKLKKDQEESLNQQLDKFFDGEIDKLMEKTETTSLIELETVLQSQGMSLETMRNMYGDRAMASEYIKAKMGPDPVYTAKQLRDEYNARLESYAIPLRVKWQQLRISIAKHGGRGNAEQVMNQAYQEIQSGADFGEIVKKYSDGPFKENGGHWDWTHPESVAAPNMRSALETLKSGQVSQVLVTPEHLQVIKVTARREAGARPFEEVQGSIREELIEAWRKERADEIVKELKETAIVETIYDDESAGSSFAVR